MAKYQEGNILTYKPLNQTCTVVNVTPYHESSDPHAFVTVELKNGDLRSVPVAKQDKYLTTDPPKKLRIWPLTKASASKV